MKKRHLSLGISILATLFVGALTTQAATVGSAIPSGSDTTSASEQSNANFTAGSMSISYASPFTFNFGKINSNLGPSLFGPQTLGNVALANPDTFTSNPTIPTMFTNENVNVIPNNNYLQVSNSSGGSGWSLSAYADPLISAKGTLTGAYLSLPVPTFTTIKNTATNTFTTNVLTATSSSLGLVGQPTAVANGNSYTWSMTGDSHTVTNSIGQLPATLPANGFALTDGLSVIVSAGGRNASLSTTVMVPDGTVANISAGPVPDGITMDANTSTSTTTVTIPTGTSVTRNNINTYPSSTTVSIAGLPTYNSTSNTWSITDASGIIYNVNPSNGSSSYGPDGSSSGSFSSSSMSSYPTTLVANGDTGIAGNTSWSITDPATGNVYAISPSNGQASVTTSSGTTNYNGGVTSSVPTVLGSSTTYIMNATAVIEVSGSSLAPTGMSEALNEDNGTSYAIAQAGNGTGQGIWLLNWDPNSTQLYVPTTNQIYSNETYISSIHWGLSIAAP